MGERQFRVWCLLGRKAGDNTQVRALAAELGWDCDEKTIDARPWELLVHIGHRATLAGINRQTSSELAAPWPDVVLTAGRRNEPVAQWIRQQSGNRAVLVHIGRPWAPLEDWDLIVTTPQYFLPERANVLHNQLPLHLPAVKIDADEAGDIGRWKRRFSALPRPWIALLVGGDSGPFVFTPDKAARLGALADGLAGRSGGSLLVTDSPRTSATASDALFAAIEGAYSGHRWLDDTENPYRAVLALADAFIVTGESMSMLAEAAESGRPLFIFDPGDRGDPWWKLAHNYRYKPLSFRLGMTVGPARMRRDIGRIQSALVATGAAKWLTSGSPPVTPAVHEEPGDSRAREELTRSAQAVRQLVTAR